MSNIDETGFYEFKKKDAYYFTLLELVNRARRMNTYQFQKFQEHIEDITPQSIQRWSDRVDTHLAALSEYQKGKNYENNIYSHVHSHLSNCSGG